MNIENLKLIRERLLELDDSQFDMKYFKKDCGTVCCIAGWVHTWYGDDNTSPMSFLDRFLDVDDINNFGVLQWLTHSNWRFNFNTIADAVRRIDYVIEHKASPRGFYVNPDAFFNGEVVL